ncbi:hypothetical protein [Rufibacter sp. LB8]|uniref:hypothetical protein n=1 Tax=Rufibacter sp. LB8 TaxID=2777781 RepID=UPI00178C3779|nr:hypothetical protein [Rufibacter sp. LB8]
MTPPAGFIKATNYPGFQQEATGASIMVTELEGPVQELMTGFTADNLKTRGMVLLNKQTVDHQGAKATLYKVSQQANGLTYIKLMLLFGDAQKSIIINSMFPEQSKGLENELKTALLTAMYVKDQDPQAEEAVKFQVATAGTAFKFSTGLAGTLIFTKDGKTPTASPDQASFIVANSLGPATVQDQKAFSVNRLMKLPNGSTSVIKETNPVTIGQLPGYEIIADGKDQKGQQELVYQVILFDTNGEYYIMVGSASGDFDTNLTAFKLMANTFSRK